MIWARLEVLINLMILQRQCRRQESPTSRISASFEEIEKNIRLIALVDMLIEALNSHFNLLSARSFTPTFYTDIPGSTLIIFWIPLWKNVVFG